MKPPGADTVVVRYGEIGTKSRQVRGWMSRQLIENLGALLADRGLSGDVERRDARVIVETTEQDVEAATAAAADTFGVTSASAARRVEPTMDAITAALAQAASEIYDGGSFAVDAQRSGSQSFTSEDLARRGGSAVWEAAQDEFEPEVDLDDPDVTFYVDCRHAEAFVFLEKRRAPGGLPLGSQKPLVALVSGGIDSPVAAYETMKRGAPIVPVYLDLGDYGGSDHRARAISTVGELARLAPNFDMDVRVVPAGDAVAGMVEHLEKGRMIAFRRYMFRVAEHLAEATDAVGIVTGEAIGQKSSQTTQNLAVTSAATDLPTHRPLVTVNKTDISERAREIGTFTDSTLPAGCNRLAPEQAETNAILSRQRELEPDDLFDWARRDADAVETVAPR